MWETITDQLQYTIMFIQDFGEGPVFIVKNSDKSNCICVIII